MVGLGSRVRSWDSCWPHLLATLTIRTTLPLYSFKDTSCPSIFCTWPTQTKHPCQQHPSGFKHPLCKSLYISVNICISRLPALSSSPGRHQNWPWSRRYCHPPLPSKLAQTYNFHCHSRFHGIFKQVPNDLPTFNHHFLPLHVSTRRFTRHMTLGPSLASASTKEISCDWWVPQPSAKHVDVFRKGHWMFQSWTLWTLRCLPHFFPVLAQSWVLLQALMNRTFKAFNGGLKNST